MATAASTPMAMQNTVDLCLRQLPKQYQFAPRVRSDVVALLTATPSLNPKIDTLTYDNGAQTTLLSVSGTIPIWYMNNQYNIPIRVWVVENYPHHPPLCFVTPTQSMVIKERHPHVDRSGRCYLPYLTQWNAQVSNLAVLIGQLALIFGQNPPVFERASQPRPQPQPQPQFQPQPVSVHPPIRPLPVPSKDTNDSVLLRTTTDNVTHKLQARLLEVAQMKTKEIDSLFDSQHKLEERNTQIEALKEQFKKEKESLVGMITAMTQKDDELTKWQSQQTGQEIDIDKVIEPKDVLSQQILDLVAEENALEDVLYVLDQALHRDRIDLDNYLKLIRGYSREQFFRKALLNKVASIQMSRR